jgi:hypothetical protein
MSAVSEICFTSFVQIISNLTFAFLYLLGWGKIPPLTAW